VVLTRNRAIPLLANITVAAVTRTVRGLPTEVAVGKGEGLSGDAVVNCDNLFTVPKQALRNRRGELGPEQVDRLRLALMTALELD
jgi:mRNA interferase MazF